MKNSDLWNSYGDYTEKTSNIVRWLSSILFGYVYIEGNTSNVILGLLLFIFIIDFFQYFISALIYKSYARKQELKSRKEHGSIENEFEGVPTSLDRLSFSFWCFKIFIFLVVIISLICIFIIH